MTSNVFCLKNNANNRRDDQSPLSYDENRLNVYHFPSLFPFIAPWIPGGHTAPILPAISAHTFGVCGDIPLKNTGSIPEFRYVKQCQLFLTGDFTQILHMKITLLSLFTPLRLAESDTITLILCQKFLMHLLFTFWHYTFCLLFYEGQQLRVLNEFSIDPPPQHLWC